VYAIRGRMPTWKSEDNKLRQFRAPVSSFPMRKGPPVRRWSPTADRLKGVPEPFLGHNSRNIFQGGVHISLRGVLRYEGMMKEK